MTYSSTFNVVTVYSLTTPVNTVELPYTGEKAGDKGNQVGRAIKKGAEPISNEISVYVKNSGLPVQLFCHDMTFGKGMAALLSSHASVPIGYYSKRTPVVFTNDNGRTLNDGVYLSN